MQRQMSECGLYTAIDHKNQSFTTFHTLLNLKLNAQHLLVCSVSSIMPLKVFKRGDSD